MFLFARCLHLLVKIFIKSKDGLMMNPGVEKRSICVWLLYCVINFNLLIRESFDFTVEWFADFELFASTGEELV